MLTSLWTSAGLKSLSHCPASSSLISGLAGGERSDCLVSVVRAAVSGSQCLPPVRSHQTVELEVVEPRPRTGRQDWPRAGLEPGPSSPGRRSRDGHDLPLHHTSLYLRQELEILRSSLSSIHPSLININPSILEGNTNIRFRIIQICHDLKKFVNENIYISIFIPTKAFLIFCGFNQLNRKSSNHLIVLKLYNI